MAFWRRKKDHNGTSPTGAADPVPLDNSALVDAMRAVAVNDSEQTRADLFTLLLGAKLIVSTPDSPLVESSWTAGPDETMKVAMLQDEDGVVLPVFTSVASLLEWRPQGGTYTALAATALLQMAMNVSAGKVVVDPASDPRGVLTGYEIATLASGRLPLGGAEVAPAGTPVDIGAPSTPPPDEVVQAVRDALAAEPGAQAAWLYVQRQEGYEPEMVIGVELRDGIEGEAEQAAMRRIVDAAGARSAGVGALAFTVVSEDGGLRQAIVTGGDEIFRR